MAALKGKPGCFTDGQEAIAVAAKQEGPDAFAVFLNSTMPRDAPYGFRPDWNTCPASVVKRHEMHSQVGSNLRQHNGIYKKKPWRANCHVVKGLQKE